MGCVARAAGRGSCFFVSVSTVTNSSLFASHPVQPEKNNRDNYVGKLEKAANITLVKGDKNQPMAVEMIVMAETRQIDRKSTRLNSSHSDRSRMPSSA